MNAKQVAELIRDGRSEPVAWRYRPVTDIPWRYANEAPIGLGPECITEPLYAAPHTAKLTKPAQVGNASFGVGVKERLVIERAQREYEYQQRPENEAERLKRAEAFRAAISVIPTAALDAAERLLDQAYLMLNAQVVLPEDYEEWRVAYRAFMDRPQ
jgi:hypothetical protein